MEDMFCPFQQRKYVQESSLDFSAGTQHEQENVCKTLQYSTNHPMPTHLKFT